MKSRLLICTAIMFCATAVAQNTGITRLGIVDGEVSQPQTTLYVDITVEKQDVIAGPYARYAQKYLGVSAPLADKVLHEVKSAKVSNNNGKQATAIAKSNTVLHMKPNRGFPKLAIDKKANTQLSLEESARLAADEIFKIRKSRYELITGEAGENVFGSGLRCAITELNKLEEEYLSMFLGKQTNSTVVKQYNATPSAGKQTYIVCRFSNMDGLLPDDDLSGQPIVLETKVLNNISTEDLNVLSKPSKYSSAYRIPADALCRIILDGSEITSVVIPVYQFGQTLHIAP